MATLDESNAARLLRIAAELPPDQPSESSVRRFLPTPAKKNASPSIIGKRAVSSLDTD
jgi:hypothetical protein